MQLDLLTIKHVHFIGIGGIGVSAIARMMIGQGKQVSGQDMHDSEIIHALQKLGAEITVGQTHDAIPANADLVVYTIAIQTYDPVLFENLTKLEIPVRSYPQMLHEVTAGKYTIAISGTHGKTTTTAMIAGILSDAQKDPTVIVGSLLSSGTNFIAGHSEYVVVEACEYRRSFLNIEPTILVITNIDEDHMDYYTDIEDIKSAFRELAMKVPSNGYIVCNPADKNIADVIKDVKATIVDYSTYVTGTISLKVPGAHNKRNAAAAVALGETLGIAVVDSTKSLGEFSGTWRRFQRKGTLANGACLYDDYAHHPKEIIATLEGFRELYPKNQWKIIVLFQPHLFSRTKSLFTEFTESFNDADTVVVLPIYAAREEDDGTVSSGMLARDIAGPHAVSAASFTDAEKYIHDLPVDDHTVVVTMGAGDVYTIADALLKE